MQQEHSKPNGEIPDERSCGPGNKDNWPSNYLHLILSLQETVILDCCQWFPIVCQHAMTGYITHYCTQ